jgi:hypothetical protein
LSSPRRTIVAQPRVKYRQSTLDTQDLRMAAAARRTRGGTPGTVSLTGRTTLLLALLHLTTASLSARVSAQVPGDTLLVAAGPQYEAGSVRRALHGDNWRELWVVPVRVPVLDIRTFAGGLEPLRRGGGNQTITLHMVDAQGRRWIFRSIDKQPGGAALPPDVRGTPAAAIVQDHTSILHPGGYFILPALLEAVGVLHAQPTLYVMPDDPALGEFREDYAGMLGELELRPDEGPDNTPGFAGSRSVKSSENFLEDLESGHEHLLDQAELLRARLVDFLVGDPDRGTDQWRWARYGEKGAYTWRPIPADRDWALARGDGLLARPAAAFYPKLVRFRDEYPSIETLTYSSHVIDRGLLTRLDRQAFMAEAVRVQSAITDQVIERAVSGLPPEYAALSGAEIAASLRIRRDRLLVIAGQFYDWLATEVDVRGTDERDYAEIERYADGSVRVRIWPLAAVENVVVRTPSPADPAAGMNGAAAVPPAWYDRVFLPSETREIRVYLHGDDDHARVLGEQDGPITLRIVAGGGDDLLEDFAGNARFYVDRGDNRVHRAAGTRVDERPWHAPAPEEGLRAGSDWAPDFGGTRGVRPSVGYRDRAGVLVGASLNATRYGFRRLPHYWDLDVRALYAPETGGVSAEVELDHRLINSRATLLLDARATTLESFRFHGFGNGTTASAGDRFDYRRIEFDPAISWTLGRLPGVEDTEAERAADADNPDADEAPQADEASPAEAAAPSRAPRRFEGTLSLGPSFAWTRADADARDRLAPLPGTAGDVLQLGLRALVDVQRVDRRGAPRRGIAFEAEAGVHPFVSGAGTYSDVAAELAAYLPLIGDGPHLALRAGGEKVFGDFPIFESAFLGGRHTLRGSATERWAGDASVYGTAELRVPIDTVTLLVRTELGVFGFGDFGRVWYQGASEGGWQSGYGAGLWLAVFGRAVSFAVARGDNTRVHAWLGMPF